MADLLIRHAETGVTPAAMPGAQLIIDRAGTQVSSVWPTVRGGVTTFVDQDKNGAHRDELNELYFELGENDGMRSESRVLENPRQVLDMLPSAYSSANRITAIRPRAGAANKEGFHDDKHAKFRPGLVATAAWGAKGEEVNGTIVRGGGVSKGPLVWTFMPLSTVHDSGEWYNVLPMHSAPTAGSNRRVLVFHFDGEAEPHDAGWKRFAETYSIANNANIKVKAAGEPAPQGYTEVYTDADTGETWYARVRERWWGLRKPEIWRAFVDLGD